MIPDATSNSSNPVEGLIGDRYRILHQIGQGGFSRTFLAVDESQPSKPRCAVKQFFLQPQNQLHADKASLLFEQEAARLKELGNHDCIPTCLDYLEAGQHRYLIQEFIEGPNLEEELEKLGPFSEAQIWRLLTNLLPTLQFIHSQNIIHRDVKPANIIRRKQDGQFVLVDYGAARFATGTLIAGYGTTIGSAEYAAPEQLRGQAFFASDLYSLGVTCIYLLTQISPFTLFDIHTDRWVWDDFLLQSISEDLGWILDGLLEQAVSHRYQSVEEVLADFAPFLPEPKSNGTNEILKPAVGPFVEADVKPNSLTPKAFGDRRLPEDEPTATTQQSRPEPASIPRNFSQPEVVSNPWIEPQASARPLEISNSPTRVLNRVLFQITPWLSRHFPLLHRYREDRLSQPNLPEVSGEKNTKLIILRGVFGSLLTLYSIFLVARLFVRSPSPTADLGVVLENVGLEPEPFERVDVVRFASDDPPPVGPPPNARRFYALDLVSTRPDVIISRNSVNSALTEFSWSGSSPEVRRSLSVRLTDVATIPDSSAAYAISNHSLYEIDLETGTVTEMTIPPTFPELSWTQGITYDPERRRMFVATLGGEGYLYEYRVDTNEWVAAHSLNNIDLEAIAYSPQHDRLFGIETNWGDRKGPHRLVELRTDGSLVRRIELSHYLAAASEALPLIQLASNGDYLAVVVGYDSQTIYSIDPKTGEVRQTN